jgi:inorganic phosphate transporter, PiT family
MAAAWLITLPSAGLVGAVTYWIVHGIGGYPGAILGFLLLVAVATAIYLQSRKTKVDHTNVNAEWKGDLTAGLDDDGHLGVAGAPIANSEKAGTA